MTTIKVSTNTGTTRFSCPICRAISICDIRYMSAYDYQRDTEMYFLVCRACGKGSTWKQFNRRDNYNFELRLVEPLIVDAPHPEADMPDDVKADYEEARHVVDVSPRSAAALLRLSLQKLCKHLGRPGEHLDADIRTLAKQPEFGDRLIKAADTLRITGNNAVHPGEMSEEDIDGIAGGLFDLLNLIVRSGISEPKKWDKMYQALPEGARAAAEKKDGRK